MDSYLDFLKDDLETGLLKNKRVGMIRRRVKICGGKIEDCISYFIEFKDKMKGGNNNNDN